MGKNVAVFVDVANIFYAAKAAGVDIDYVTLLRSSTAGRDFVRAYAYTGLDPDNENQRNFHQFLARHNYKVVSKDIRKYGDGKVKANLDIELVVDMMKTARNLDVAVLVSGDGDFAPAIRAVQEMGVRVEVVSFRGNTSSDLIDVADLFTDITQIAKVEKGSTRSGRRVTEDDEDLSMTEVPDKQSEGAGESRGRGRGRTSTRGRGRETRDRDEAPVPVAASSRGSVTALPGEKLSKAAPAGEVEEPEIDEDVDGLVAAASSDEGVDGDGRRRRRRRGGRGRGRGRAAEDGAPEGEAAPVAVVPAAAGPLPTPFDDDEPEPGPRGPKPTPFGSVWDSQIGMPTARPGGELEPLGDEDEEPAIPEYLIAERRGGGNRTGAGGGGQRGAGGRGGGGRGGGGRGGAYAAAIDRERYGRGGPISRYPEPARGGSGGGGGGGGGSAGGRGGRDDRYGGGRGGDRDRDRGAYSRPAGGAARHSGGDPWSEVPPELEELVRAQLARSRPSGEARPIDADVPEQSGAPTTADADAAPARRRTRRTTAADAPVAETAAAIDEAAPKSRTTRRTASAETPAVAEAATEAPKRRTTTRRTTAATPAADTADAPKATRTRRPKATAADAETGSTDAAPKRRTRRTTTESAEG